MPNLSLAHTDMEYTTCKSRLSESHAMLKGDVHFTSYNLFVVKMHVYNCRDDAIFFI